MDPLLLTFTGRDAPGITAAIAEVLAAASARLLDIEQVVVQDFLVLGFSVSFDDAQAEERALKELLFAARQRGLSLDYARRPAHAADDRELFAATAIGRPLGPEAIHAVARVLAEHGGNIERIHELSEGGLTSVEFSVSLPASADAAPLKRALLAAAGQGRFDCALQKESLLRRSKRLVVMDMDSTLIGIEVIDELARAHGVFEDVSRITRRAMMGEIDYDQSLRERVALLAGLDASALDRVYDDLVLAPGARTTVRTLKRLGYRFAVVSGGFSQITDRLADDLGIDFAAANELEVV
ncbi:MAG: phosphoserine phosphatase SerB, partial [Myxococcales bacterium]